MNQRVMSTPTYQPFLLNNMLDSNKQTIETQTPLEECPVQVQEEPLPSSSQRNHHNESDDDCWEDELENTTATNSVMRKIPVTLLSGFLGAGKHCKSFLLLLFVYGLFSNLSFIHTQTCGRQDHSFETHSHESRES